MRTIRKAWGPVSANLESITQETYPLDTKISLDGRKPSITCLVVVPVVRESSIQKQINTPSTNTKMKSSNARRTLNDPSGRENKSMESVSAIAKAQPAVNGILEMRMFMAMVVPMT